MAITQSAWSTSSTNGKKIMECTVAIGATETDAMTLKTPKALNTSKPFHLLANAAGVTIDADTVAVDLWVGTKDDSTLSGTGTLTASDAYFYKAIIADVKAAVGSCVCDPNLTTADVSNVHVQVPPAPYYFFNLDGTNAMTNVTVTFIIIQDSDGDGGSALESVGGIGADPS